MHSGILGSGLVGSKLGTIFARAGHEVIFGYLRAIHGTGTTRCGRAGHHARVLFRMVAHDQNGGVIVVTHDHCSLDVFDTIYEMEDGIITRQEAEATA
jgi:hypothetical protein